MDKNLQPIPALKSMDYILESVAVASLMALWGYVAWAYGDLPETIPTHFNFRGEADGFGSKTTFFLLPTVGTALFGLLTLVSRSPRHFNYPVKITAENWPYQARLATRLLRWLKIAIVWIFTGIGFETYQTAVSGHSTGPMLVLPLALALVLGPLIVYLVLAGRKPTPSVGA